MGFPNIVPILMLFFVQKTTNTKIGIETFPFLEDPPIQKVSFLVISALIMFLLIDFIIFSFSSINSCKGVLSL